MLRKFASGLAVSCVVFAASGSAVAQQSLERQLLSATGNALIKSIQEDSKAGVAICEDARKLIVPGSPAFLNFYIERCLAAVVEPGGVMGGARCPHYEKAIAIWRASPPKVDPAEEDEAIKRAKMLRQAVEDSARYCTPGASPRAFADPEAMAIPPTPGATLETQEGLAYALPPGFGVKSFDPDSGLAILRDPVADLILRVERKGLNDASARSLNYPDRETMPSGAVLAWEYNELIQGSGSYVLYGRVTLTNAYVVLGVTTGAKSAEKSVDKSAGLELFRKIAGSVHVIGPRRCIGECGPGKLQ
jgi:hypothetical protein